MDCDDRLDLDDEGWLRHMADEDLLDLFSEDESVIEAAVRHFIGLASEDEASPEALSSYGFSEAFKKPFDIALLAERIRSLVEEKRANL